MELIQQLTQGLGVDEGQAKGGAGLIFKMAQEKLGDSDFAQVANVIPGLGDLIGEAPAEEEKGLAGAIGGLAGMMGGGSGSQLANMAALAGGFSKLGLSPAMATKFIPIILSFTQSKGGDQVKNILAGILK